MWCSGVCDERRSITQSLFGMLLKIMLYVIQLTPNSGFSVADYIINITLTFLPKLFYFPICVDPSPPCQLPCGRKPERPEKPTTFGRVLTNTFHMSGGASWPKGSPFTSEVADSIFSENVVNVNRTQWPTNVKSQHSAESRGFSPVSSDREVDWVG